jgi:hypothetical protein
MYASFEYDGLFAKFWSIFAIYNRDQPSLDRRSPIRTRVNVRLGCLAGTPSTNMYACGVTTAGLMKRRKKNPPISEQMAMSVASGYFL